MIKSIKSIFFFCFILSSGITAQVRLGVKASLTIPFSKNQLIQYDDYQDFLVYEVKVLQQNISPEFGLIGFYSNDLLFLQAEAFYKKVETDFEIASYVLDDVFLPRERKETSYLTFPINAGIIINKTFKLGFGPVFSFIIDDSYILENVEYFEEKQSQIEKGFSFSFGVLVKRLHFDLRYESRFDGVAEDFYFRDTRQGFRQRPGYLSFGVGLVL